MASMSAAPSRPRFALTAPAGGVAVIDVSAGRSRHQQPKYGRELPGDKHDQRQRNQRGEASGRKRQQAVFV